MAEVAGIRIYDIALFQVGSDTYEGITEAAVQINDPEIAPIRKTGHAYPSQMQVTQTNEFPVVLRIRTADMAQMLALLAAAAANVIIQGKVAGSVTNKVITVTNGKFRKPSQRIGTDPGRFGETNLECVAVSADGSALPIAISDAA